MLSDQDSLNTNDDEAPGVPDRPSGIVPEDVESEEAAGVLDSWFFGRREAVSKLEEGQRILRAEKQDVVLER